MRISYNAPTVLSFSILTVTVYCISHYILPFSQGWFVTYPQFNFGNPMDYFRLISHIFGHENWKHLAGNFMFILLLGPILEEKYGSQTLLLLIILTAFITALLNTLFFNTGLLGASGIVFLFILLASFTTFRSGEIPLTFILVFIIFIGQELFDSLKQDQISHFAHIMGGIVGSSIGYGLNKKQ